MIELITKTCLQLIKIQKFLIIQLIIIAVKYIVNKTFIIFIYNVKLLKNSFNLHVVFTVTCMYDGFHVFFQIIVLDHIHVSAFFYQNWLRFNLLKCFLWPILVGFEISYPIIKFIWSLLQPIHSDVIIKSDMFCHWFLELMFNWFNTILTTSCLAHDLLHFVYI